MLGCWLRTGVMFVFMTALLMLVGGIVGYFLGGYWMIGTAVMLAISLLICFVSYYKSKDMALKANHVKIIFRSEQPRLYDMVQELADKAGLPMPEVGIVDSPLPNAFATGRNPENAAVVATTGILDLLPDDELRGVLAHEMSHIKNRDILVMGIASALAIVISYAARITWYLAFFGSGNNRDNNRGIIILIALAAQILVPFAALLIQMGVSRSREYLADESGGILINDPRALARALDHLDKGSAPLVMNYTLEGQDPRTNPTAAIMTNSNYAHMWISNPLKKEGFWQSLFSTHPPMQDRIDRLNKLADKMGL